MLHESQSREDKHLDSTQVVLSQIHRHKSLKMFSRAEGQGVRDVGQQEQNFILGGMGNSRDVTPAQQCEYHKLYPWDV